MRNLALYSIRRPVVTWLIMAFCLVGGLWGFSGVGRLEDPAFTIKQAVVVTIYPGATAAEVAREVSEPLEAAFQGVEGVDVVRSRNRAGVSEITIELASTVGPDEVPQIWDEIRREVSDAAPSLPAGVLDPIVNDSFGDVFGLMYAVTATGFSDGDVHDVAQFLRRELLAAPGVGDVEIQGLPEEAIFIEPSNELVFNLGVSPEAILDAISTSDSVAPAGAVDGDGVRIVIERPEGDDTLDDLARITVGVGGALVNLQDLVEVRRGRVAEPAQIIRHNGAEAFTFGVSGAPGVNIVEVGLAVEAALATLEERIPVGVEIHPIYEQHIVVDQSVNGFIENLMMSVAIVIGVLALFMGWRAGVVVGGTLVLTVVATFFFMAVYGIQIERISLGALIIAMGMLVDNAIVVAEGMQVAMGRGRKSEDAAAEVADKTSFPLLGATVIGVMAFAGIGLSPDETGEFMFSLFAVIAISLMLSWALAVTVTPLLGHYMFVRGDGDGADAYGGPLFQAYSRFLRAALGARRLVIVGLVALTALCYYAFGYVTQQFFPDSTTPLFYVHYDRAQGASIYDTAEDLEVLEAWLQERPEVTDVTTSVGQGVSRFLLTYDSARSDPSYGHLIVRVRSLDEIPAVADALSVYAAEALPEGMTRVKRLVFGPGASAEIEARFSGPDPDVLRRLADEAQAILAASALVRDARVDWRQRVFSVRPIYAVDRSQALGVTRDLLSTSLLIATEGLRAGEFREGERLIPIIIRSPEGSRADDAALLNQLVFSPALGGYVRIDQVVDGFEIETRDPLIYRRDRVTTVTVQAESIDGATAETAFADIQAAIEAIELPVGYAFEWGGTHESSTEAQASLGQQTPISLLVMVVLTVLLFGRWRQPLVIWLLVPMSVNGVAIGLLGSGLPFTFTAILGLLSLSGMLIKNGIVLVEEIDVQREAGLPLQEAIETASVSRVRPVILAAGTTILGMLPLLWDAFFASMAVTIMGGLAFASVLTLIAAPVFYASLFAGVERRRTAAAGVAADAAPA